ncbi:uncharacterized protein ACNLHF_014912 isoform 1-T5 [Anomaloglossus baeobatrachus]
MGVTGVQLDAASSMLTALSNILCQREVLFPVYCPDEGDGHVPETRRPVEIKGIHLYSPYSCGFGAVFNPLSPTLNHLIAAGLLPSTLLPCLLRGWDWHNLIRHRENKFDSLKSGNYA